MKIYKRECAKREERREKRARSELFDGPYLLLPFSFFYSDQDTTSFLFN